MSLASLWAVAVMALGASQVAFLPAQEGAQGAVGAVQRVGRQTQCRRGPVGAGLGLGAHDPAAGDAVVWAEPQPGRKVLGAGPFRHVGANLTHHLERGVGIHTVDLGQVNPRCPASTIFAGPVASLRNVTETLAPGVPPDQR